MQFELLKTDGAARRGTLTLAHGVVQGERLLKGLQEIHHDFPELTANPRGRGLFCALDLATPALRDAVLVQARERGMMILSTGVRGLRFRPALNLRPEDLDLGVTLLREAVATVDASAHTLVG